MKLSNFPGARRATRRLVRGVSRRSRTPRTRNPWLVKVSAGFKVDQNSRLYTYCKLSS